VATLGTATSRDHIQTLFKAVPEIVFCFDGDNAGRQAAWRALEVALPELDDRHQIRFLFLPQSEDPDSYVQKHGREKFDALLKSAVSLATYLFDNLKQRFDIATLEGRARLAEEAKSLIAKTQDNIFRQLLMKELSDITRLNIRELGLGKMSLAPAQQQQHRPRPNLQVEMNNMRKAVAAVLARPGLAQGLEIPQGLRTLNNAGVALLFEITDICRAEPGLTAGRLVQRYQEDNSPHAGILSKLAAYQFADDSDEAIKHELTGALTQLEKEALDLRYQQLLEKMSDKTISDAEKRELQSYRRG
jgi:DNA primase